MNQTDFKKWEAKIRSPQWYQQIVPDLERLAKLRDTDHDAYNQTKEEVYAFFEDHLLRGTIALGTTGKDWDSERKQIDTIVIHHTSNPPGMRLSRLSAIELVRLYAPCYAHPDKEDEDIIGHPVYSGHFRDGIQNFWPYHWFVRTGGTTERLLRDEETGWQAGNWEINCRSVAICFDGDFEDGQPSDIELSAATQIIRNYYPNVSKNRVLGHCEVTPKTFCPSKCFLSAKTQRGWKEDLLALI